MRGRHRNVFYYYRGPTTASASSKDEDRYQQQVEDNSTKALVNVLDLGGGDLIRSFLGRFVPPLAAGWSAGSTPELFLQGGPQPAPAGTRLLLGLSILAHIDGPLTPDGPGSRIDAAILVPGVGMLAIEVKVVDDLNGAQLARHMEHWGITGPPVLVRWADVWRWARAQLQGNPEPVRFLLGQLCDYLEILGFAPWGGFREEDFEFFASPTLEQRSIVRSRMSNAWHRVFEELNDDQRRLLGQAHSNQLPMTGSTAACAQTNFGQPVVNLTLELNSYELQLNVVGWNDAPARLLVTWLHSPTGGVVTAELRGFEVVLFERTAIVDHAGNPFWQRAIGNEVDRFAADTVGTGALARWIDGWEGRTDPKWRKLAVHIRRTYSRPVVLGQAEGLAATLASDVRRLLPVLRAVNRWD